MPPSLLRAFRHPLILLSIAMLLLNDHLFKWLSPSWLTGKLSDFAGLFFFPFLLGVLLQAGQSKRITSRHALIYGMLISAVIFLMVKTLLPVNAWAVDQLSALYGQPASIALDPTDCIALLVFLPAWQLWQAIEQQKRPSPPGKLAYMTLALGSLAAMATAPCMPAHQVTRLALEDEVLYAGVGYSDLAYGGIILASPDGWENWRMVMVSQSDGGKIQWLPQVGNEALAKNPFTEPVQFPKTVCDPANPQTCYRIDGSARVEESPDGGANWKTVWQPSTDREGFRRRLAEGIMMQCGKTPDLQPFDLLIYPGESGSTLLVAIGNEGLLVRSPQGKWQTAGIKTSDNDRSTIEIIPTPLAILNPIEAVQLTTFEFLLALSLGLLSWFLLRIWAWENILAQVGPPLNQRMKQIRLSATLASIWTALLPAGLLYLTQRGAVLLLTYLASPYWIGLFFLALWNFHTLPNDLPDEIKKIERSLLLCGVLVFVIIWLPIALWTFGVIRGYTTALVLAVGMGIAGVIGSVRWLQQRMVRADGKYLQR